MKCIIFTLKKSGSGISEVKALAIVRDAETDASKAIRDIQHALKSINLPAPNQAFDYSSQS